MTKQRTPIDYRARAETLRSRWGDPAYRTEDLLREAQVSRNTANKYLGCGREIAILKRQRRLERKEH